MFDASSPSDATLAPGEAPALGGAVRFAVRPTDRGTRLVHLHQRAPMRALFPRHAANDLLVAALVNVGGGLVGGDRARIEVAVGESAAMVVTSQAAEKVYRSLGADTVVENRLTVAAGGWLEWCPQETILFDRARLRRSLHLELGGDGRAMLGEVLVLGRLAFGERARRGLLFDRIEVRCGGELVWTDRLRLEGEFAPLLEAAAGFHGAAAMGIFIYAGPDAADHLELARALLDGHAGATAVNGLLIARWLGADPLALRRQFALFWAGFRHSVAGLPAATPRLWQI